LRATAARAFRWRQLYLAGAGMGLLVACSLERDPSHLVVVRDAPDDAGVVTPVTTGDGGPGDPPIMTLPPPIMATDAGNPTRVDAGASMSSSPTGVPDAGRTAAKDAGSARPAADASSASEGDRDSAAPMPIDPCGGPCPGDRPHCLPNGTCAACAADADCRADVPRCDPSTFKCVQCVADLDCSDLTKPECTSHHCARCTSNVACSARKDTPVCYLGKEAATSAGDSTGKEMRKEGPTGACTAASP
jgi:hypothetical protein